MRYLNKIILINSASVKYAEINVDGNVHFIGTQGVGKSTLLRALLFFYNANQQKLGIPAGKKSFVEFYFPFQDSYIIYEVVRETGAYCIIAFKSQGRVCFRFINSVYDKKYFIDENGRAFESWEKQRTAFGKEISYTKKVDRYENYRNILYGNSQSVGTEFRKYSILESKQYQNIPRAIQHVFLNYKVESEFIKDTIIKSLNEEEIKVDLSNYAHHLKNFETQLKDIKKWTEKTRNGETIVRKQAETVATTYLSIQYLENEKKKTAGELVWQLHEINNQQPVLKEKFEKQENKKYQLNQKVSDIEKKFQTKKDKINGEINVLGNKLKDAKSKSDEYAKMNIESIIQRVFKKKDWENEKEDFIKQKEILEGKFADIKQKYEAQINQFNNQLATFENAKRSEENNANQNLFHFKETLNKEYDILLEEIRKQHSDKLILAQNAVEEKKNLIQNLFIKKAEIKHHRFYETEIEKYKNDTFSFKEKIRIAESENKNYKDEIETIKKQWEIERERIEEIAGQKKSNFSLEIDTLNNKIASIETRIENSKDSFYGWLNNEYPDWENTIGKVIDEETILFQTGLSPQKSSEKDLNFYGIKLDLEEINKTVKTVADYQKDKEGFFKTIEKFQKDISSISAQMNADLENLKRRHQPAINKCKDAIRNNQYLIEQSKLKSDEAAVNLEDFTKKAETDKKSALENIETGIQKGNEEKLNSQNAVKEIENNIQKQIDQKRKDRDKKSDAEQNKTKELIIAIRLEIENKKKEVNQQIAQLKTEQLKELNTKGADTKRIAEIDTHITQLQSELDFIDAHRDKVAEYNKDKRELFDKTDFFKSEKTYFENQLETEFLKHNSAKHQLIDDIELLQQEISEIQNLLSQIEEDLKKYQQFETTDCFKSMPDLSSKPNEDFHTEKRCSTLIDELNQFYYKGIDRYRELQEAINKFTGNFSVQNIFSFKTNLTEQSEYFQFAEELKEFIDEDKISTFEKRVNELFADIIKLVGKETTGLLSKEGEIEKVINDINRDFVKRNFAGVIKSIQLRLVQSSNKVVHLLTEIKKFNDENIHDLGEANLFSSNEQTREAKNKKAIGLLSLLVKEIADYKHDDINLSDSFELEFKIVENDNDTNWVQNLANVGSDGTDVLVKAMINIMLLNVFKEGATKNKFKDFKLHCMMDEVGKLHPNNVRGILKFANDRNINLINSSPQSFDALAYRYTYKLAKDEKNVTVINRLITNNREQ
ncbi:MAG TPA: ATP-binding protein [Hanamia sp.]|nr:ATP-binding protein [Hanamia sp.]